MKHLSWPLGILASSAIFLFSTLSWGSDLTDAAQKADTYWSERYTSCVHPRFGEVWYNIIVPPVSDELIIYAQLGVVAHFNTEELSPTDRLNGVEFSATSFIQPRATRLWRSSIGWAEWTSIPYLDKTSIRLLKRNGVWSVTGLEKPIKKPLCSEIPK